jgi:hypothetical protein
MKKIKMYDFLSSNEGIYMSYLVGEIAKCESNWKSKFESRDGKLTLILNTNFSLANEEVHRCFNIIKTKINNLDFNSSDIISNMNYLAEELDKTIQYTEYLTKKIEEFECPTKTL